MKYTLFIFALFLGGCASLTPAQEASCRLDANIVNQSSPERTVEQHMAICRKQVLG